jgi:glycosyltransferase involved in cell wall biosynthesis
MAKRILIIGTESFPYPYDFNGVTENVYHILKYLSRQPGFSVDFLYLECHDRVKDEQIAELRKVVNRVTIIRKKIRKRYASALEFFVNSEFRRLLKSYDLLFWSSYTSMFNIPWGYRGKSLLYIADSMSHYLRKTPTDPLSNKFFKFLAEENVFFRFFRSVIVVSENDRQHLQKFCPGVHVIRFPIGIDMDRVPSNVGEIVYDIIFTGNLDYPPNHEAARFLITQVAPLLVKKAPEIRIMIAGRHPGDLSQYTSDQIFIPGEVDSLLALIRQSGIYVAPVFSGCGMKNKTLQAIASGLPVIGTEEAFSGFDRLPDTSVRVIPSWEQSNPEVWAGVIREWLLKSWDRPAILRNNLAFLTQTYSWAFVADHYYLPLFNRIIK